MIYGIINTATMPVYETISETKIKDDEILSAVADEGLYGHALEITGTEGGYLSVRTHYGYSGYIKDNTALKRVSLDEIKTYENSLLMIVKNTNADILSLPKVTGVCLLRLAKGSVVKLISTEIYNDAWNCIELPDGSEGFIRSNSLSPKLFSMSGLWQKDLPQRCITDEKKFRKAVMDTAMSYMGTQYAWGGKTPMGIDCSGLTSISYMLNGVLIYRDAKVISGYPVTEIVFDAVKPGDLLFFPGHTAMYLGEGMYIHSTARCGDGGVVINSLNPKHKLYREDLKKSLYAVGSIFDA